MLLRDEQSHVTQPVDQRVKVILRKFSRNVSRLPRWITQSRIRAKTRIAAGQQKQEMKPTRIKALAEWFSSFRTLLVNFVIVAALIPFLYSLVTEVRSSGERKVEINILLCWGVESKIKKKVATGQKTI